MPGDDAKSDAGGPPTCRRCDATAEFWLYRPDEPAWRPLCERHVVGLHPSLELHAWLASGYAKPAELGRPRGTPAEPESGRGAAFREIIDETLG